MTRAHARLRLRPTQLGFKAILFWFVIFAAWLATPYSNLFFLLLCFLSALAPLALLWTATNLRGLEGRIDEVQPYAAGQRGDVLVTIEGSRPTDAHGVELELAIERVKRGAAHSRSGFRAECRPGASLAARGPARPRGIWKVRGAWIVSSAPLGLLRARRAIPHPQALAVYPEAASLPEYRDRRALLAALRGDDASASAGGDFGPAGLREFREGDEARHVDWRASARKTSLVVREWEDDSMRGIEICLDRRCADEELEEALSLAVALLFVARENKEVFALETQGMSARYGEGQSSYDDALRYFAACEALPHDGPPPPTTAREVLKLPVRRLQAASAGGSR